MIASPPPFSLDAYLVQDEYTSICNGPWNFSLLTIQFCDWPQSTIHILKISLWRMRAISGLGRSELDRRGMVCEIYESINTLSFVKSVQISQGALLTVSHLGMELKWRELSLRGPRPSSMNSSCFVSRIWQGLFNVVSGGKYRMRNFHHSTDLLTLIATSLVTRWSRLQVKFRVPWKCQEILPSSRNGETRSRDRLCRCSCRRSPTSHGHPSYRFVKSFKCLLIISGATIAESHSELGDHVTES